MQQASSATPSSSSSSPAAAAASGIAAAAAVQGRKNASSKLWTAAGKGSSLSSGAPSRSLSSFSVNGGADAGMDAPTGVGAPEFPWDPTRELPTRGLLNLGNTCFFNSALQNVFKVGLLHEALFGDHSGRREGEFVGPLNKIFRRVLLEMTGEGHAGARRGAYSPKALLSGVQRAHPSFKEYHQQDAHELFMRLVGTLEDEEDSYIKKRLKEKEEEEEEAKEAMEEEAKAKAGAEGEEGAEGGVGGGPGGVDGGGGGGEKNVEALEDAASGGGGGSGGVGSGRGAKGSEGREEVGRIASIGLSEPPGAAGEASSGAGGEAAGEAAGGTAGGSGGPVRDAAESVGALRVGGGTLATVSEERGGSVALANGVANGVVNGIANGTKEAAGTPGLGRLPLEAESTSDGGGGGGGGGEGSTAVGDAASGASVEACGGGGGGSGGDGPDGASPGSVGGVTGGAAAAAKNARAPMEQEERRGGAGGVGAAEIHGASDSRAGSCNTNVSVADESNGRDSAVAKASVSAPSRVASGGSTEVACPGGVGEANGKGKCKDVMLPAGGGDGAPRDTRVRSWAGGGKRGRDVSCDSEVETSTDDGETTDAGDHDDDDIVAGAVGGRADGCAVSAPLLPPPPPPTQTGSSAEASTGGKVGETEQQRDEEEGGGGEKEAMKQEVSQGTRVGAGSVAPPPPPPPKRAAITEVFGGVMCSVVTCGSCGGRSFSTEPTVCLSLEIPLKKAPLSERAQAYLAKSRARAAGTPAATAAAAAATAENDVTTATATAAGSPTASGAHDESASKASSAAGGRPDPKALPAAPQDLLPGFQLPVSCKQRRKLARAERGRQKSMESEKQADEDAGKDASKDADTPREGNGVSATAAAATTTKTTTNHSTVVASVGAGSEAAAQSQDQEEEDEEAVRQCLEDIIGLACATADAAAPADIRGDGEDASPDVSGAAAAAAAVGSKEAIAPCADAGLEPAGEKVVDPLDVKTGQEPENPRTDEERPAAAAAAATTVAAAETAGEPTAVTAAVSTAAALSTAAAATTAAPAAVAATATVEAAATTIAAVEKEVTESATADHPATNGSETCGEKPIREESSSCAAGTSSPTPGVVVRAAECPPSADSATGLANADTASDASLPSTDNSISPLAEGEQSPRSSSPEASACARLPADGLDLDAQSALKDALVGDGISVSGGDGGKAGDDQSDRGRQAVEGVDGSAGGGQDQGRGQGEGQEEGREGGTSARGLGDLENCADDSRACRGSSASMGSRSGCTSSEAQENADPRGDGGGGGGGESGDSASFGSSDCSKRKSGGDREHKAAGEKERHPATPPAEPAPAMPPQPQLQPQPQPQASKTTGGDDEASGKDGGSVTQSAGPGAPAAVEGVEESASDHSFKTTAPGCSGEGQEIAAAAGAALTAAAASVAGAEDDAGADSDVAAPPKNPLHRLAEPPARVEKGKGHAPNEVDLYACLDHFMAEEKLVAADGNGYDCEPCRARAVEDGRGKHGGEAAARSSSSSSSEEKRDARKRLLMLGEPPGVLVCHLKRLQAKKKIIRNVEFPLELDMAPYFWQDPCAPLSPAKSCYRLLGLIQHRGSRLAGHYVAYVRDGDGWKHASDRDIRTASLPEVKDCEAYMLFYERCDKSPSAKSDTETEPGRNSVNARSVSASGSGSASDMSPGTSGEEHPSPARC